MDGPDGAWRIYLFGAARRSGARVIVHDATLCGQRCPAAWRAHPICLSADPGLILGIPAARNQSGCSQASKPLPPTMGLEISPGILNQRDLDASFFDPRILSNMEFAGSQTAGPMICLFAVAGSWHEVVQNTLSNADNGLFILAAVATVGDLRPCRSQL
jgi:hypothetical protein